ncbi:uncharacterized protein [Clytia hemisphaerica]
MTSAVGYTHYSINHDCEYEDTCIHPNKICIPNYVNGSHQCICPDEFVDEFCLKRRDDTLNLAYQKPATQSAPYNHDFVDLTPVTNGIYGEGCQHIHTEKNYAPWLRIDLGTWNYITKVDIYNRVGTTTTYLNRILNTEIYVYGESPDKERKLCGVTKGGPEFISTVCPKALPGKGVELSKPSPGSNGKTIHICEVLVYGAER